MHFPRWIAVALLLAPLIDGRECGQAELEQKNVTGCTSLTHVRYLGHKNAIWLGDALHHNVDLEAVDLHHTILGDDDAVSLAAGLQNNTHLKRLAMHNNRIFDVGAAALGEGLANNDALQELILSSNGIGDKGAKALADGLRKNRALRRLDLYVNLITDEGGIALAEALSDNRGLRSLHVDTNQLGDRAALAFAKALEGSKPEQKSSAWGFSSSEPVKEVRPALLSELTLMYSHLTNTGADALMAAAKVNTHIHSLMIDSNHMMSGDTRTAWKEEHVPAMQERHTIAKWIVGHGLVESGSLDPHKISRREWHGGDDGPPLASAYAPVVTALKLHTEEGIDALRHENEQSLAARAELESMASDERDALIKAILAETAQLAPVHDEL